MTRIIAGRAKGLRLHVPKSMKTRPTSDRVKESIFAIIGHKTVDATVMDVFAGTGSLGLEALSRGARRAVFVEKDRHALECLRRNIEHTKMVGESQIVVPRRGLPDEKALGEHTFDLVLADPPYDSGWVTRFAQWVQHVPRLHKDVWIVVEHSKKEELPPNLEKLTVIREAVYGTRAVTIMGVQS